MLRIGLVSCVKQKRATRTQAKDLYTSELFVRARGYSEAHYDRWLILSAKYRLVEPETYIEPYDETLNKMAAVERKAWSETVLDQIVHEFPDPKAVKLFFHAGARYREFLIPLLDKASYSYEVPLQGLKIGEQLAWYNKCSEHG